MHYTPCNHTTRNTKNKQKQKHHPSTILNSVHFTVRSLLCLPSCVVCPVLLCSFCLFHLVPALCTICPTCPDPHSCHATEALSQLLIVIFPRSTFGSTVFRAPLSRFPSPTRLVHLPAVLLLSYLLLFLDLDSFELGNLRFPT